MPLVSSAWPAVAWVLPVLALLSVLYFLAKGDRRALGHVLALVACFLIGALLMEFFVFMAARMARSGSAQADPALGTGTRQLLQTLANPRSITAPAGSLAWVAAWSVPVAYLGLVAAWAVHLWGLRASPARKKAVKTGTSGRKSPRARKAPAARA
ncbi:hypothetical protein [Paracidovorax sp. MALMAid1276]|uniref:hypothetical protein n=1 Tax=Paracidovorax sp. MALMAid1276 TaxID=3411631 RepID=UPI003B98FDCF